MLTTTRRRDDPPDAPEAPARKRHLVALPSAGTETIEEPRPLAERVALAVTLFVGFQIALLAILGL
jgi:hypothetical protein